jgi:hypothetical protein
MSWERTEMAKPLFRLEIRGIDSLVKRLDEFGVRARNRILNKGFALAAQPIVRAAQARLNTISKSGNLGDAVQFKTKAYKRGKVLVLLIGTQTHLSERLSSRGQRRLAAGRVTKLSEATYPSNIASLIEEGHGGPLATPPRPFLGPAVDSQLWKFMSIVEHEIADELTKVGR